MNVHHDLQAITDVALHYAKEHNCNYNIILKNPGTDGEFSFANGSTYEFVTDSYQVEFRSNVKLIYKTDDLLQVNSSKEVIIDLRDSALTKEKAQQWTEQLIAESDRQRGVAIRTRQSGAAGAGIGLNLPYQDYDPAKCHTMYDTVLGMPQCSPRDFGMNYKRKRKRK